MNETDVQALRIKGSAKLPAHVHPGDVGYDLFILGDHVVQPGERLDLPTGIALAMGDAIYARITGRSSASRRGLHVVEGIIDSGYRGELFAAVVNQTDHPIELRHHERVAQVVFALAVRPVIQEISVLPRSVRGDAGFGSTGP